MPPTMTPEQAQAVERVRQSLFDRDPATGAPVAKPAGRTLVPDSPLNKGGHRRHWQVAHSANDPADVVTLCNLAPAGCVKAQEIRAGCLAAQGAPEVAHQADCLRTIFAAAGIDVSTPVPGSGTVAVVSAVPPPVPPATPKPAVAPAAPPAPAAKPTDTMTPAAGK